MSANNTTPQQRVNKLGHVVTKHVLTAPAAKSLTTALPAPAAGAGVPVPAASREERIKKLITEMNVGTLFGAGSDLRVRAALSSFSDSTLDLISSTVRWHQSMGMPRIRFMYSVLTETPEETVREMMSVVPLFRDECNTEEMLMITEGLHHVKQFEGKCLENLTGADRELLADFIHITSEVYIHFGSAHLGIAENAKGERTLYLKPELAEVVAAHPGTKDDIVEFFRERETTDAAQLREYLQIGVLREGVL